MKVTINIVDIKLKIGPFKLAQEDTFNNIALEIPLNKKKGKPDIVR